MPFPLVGWQFSQGGVYVIGFRIVGRGDYRGGWAALAGAPAIRAMAGEQAPEG